MDQSVIDLFISTTEKKGAEIALKYKKNDSWQSLTFSEVKTKVTRLMGALREQGVGPGDRIGICSQTRYEWVIADLAILGLGACTVPAYESSTDTEIGYIAADSEIKLLFVSEKAGYEKAKKARIFSKLSFPIVVLGETAALDLETKDFKFEELLDSKSENTEIYKTSGDTLATIVYTSGTTGLPKGALITHANLVYEAKALSKWDLLAPNDTQLLFLPLAHIFARVAMITWLKTGHVLAFAEGFEQLTANMLEIKPTVVAAVPRLFEKIQAAVVKKFTFEPGVKGRVARWGNSLATEAMQAEIAGRKPTNFLWPIAQRVVFEKVGEGLKEKFGGRLRYFVSGGAPLSKEVAYFLRYAGINILEGYGLTETSGATCVNLCADNQIGTVGKPLPGTDVKIADDGEVLVKGPGVFQGYLNKPKETAKVFDKNGWFKTGDIGRLDASGHLHITDRKKDILITAGGKNVAPQKIENLLKQKTPLIGHAVVLGDARPYLVALVTLDSEHLGAFAQESGLKGEFAALTQNPVVKSYTDGLIDKMNSGLPRYEQVKKIAVLDHEFEIGDQLTPTLKVKRTACLKKYKKEINELYDS